jgi:hypothetical protein
MSTLKSVTIVHPSSATNNIVNDASGNVAIGNNLTVAGTATVGGVAAVAVAPSTAGNVLTSTGSAWASTAPSGGGLPTPSAIGQIPFSTNGSTYAATQKIVQGTAVTLTSQTSVDFTSIPSWVKRITIQFSSISTSGTSQWLIQIGSGSVQASGYAAASARLWAAVTAATNATGFNVYVASASATNAGEMVLTSVGANTWISTHSVYETFPAVMTGAGNVTLSGTLDRVRLTTVNGTDTLDAGTVNILYE